MHILNLGLYLPSDISIGLLEIQNAGAADGRLALIRLQLLMQLARLLGSWSPLFMCEERFARCQPQAMFRSSRWVKDPEVQLGLDLLLKS
jgi:hypothetical protein